MITTFPFSAMVRLELAGTLRWVLVALLLGLGSVGVSQEAPQSDTDEKEAQPSEADELALLQAQLADKYRRLEELLFKRADFEATVNPRRAALLKEAYQQSKNRLTRSQIDAIVRLLNQEQLTRAVEGQERVQKDLEALLQLLLSENRSDRLKSEQQKIKEYIRELKNLEKLQRAERGRNEGGADFKDLAKNQAKIADRAANLEGKMAKDDAAKAAEAQNAKSAQDGSQPSDSAKDGGKSPKQGEDKGSQEKGQQGEKDGDSSENQPGKEGQKNDQADPGQKSSEGQQGQQGEDSRGAQNDQGQQGQQGQQRQQGQQGQQGQQDQQQSSQDENPARKRLQEAQEKMEEAKRRLEEAKRKESIEAQEEAAAKLREAIAELEEILRQMREEEIERMLAMLEGRFKRMLQMQLRVYERTLRLGKIPKAQRNRAVVIEANKLSFDERKIVAEADRALNLLLEEGSSVAFPEVVQQMRDDMETVAERLAKTRVDRMTQGLEEEIIQTLEELIEALKQAQQDLEDQRQQPQQPPNQNPTDQPLVDMLAELRMIRSLQLRINRRTKRYAQMLDDPDKPLAQAEDADLQAALERLSERQDKLQRITRDIVLGKNQ